MQSETRRDTQKLIIVGLSSCLLTLLLLICVGVGAFGGLYLRQSGAVSGITLFPANPSPVPLPTLPLASPVMPALATLPPTPPVLPTAVPIAEATAVPVPSLSSSTVALPITLDQHPVPDNAQAYLERLYLADHPANDYYDTAVRLGKLDIGARTSARPSFNIGDRQVFQTEDGVVEATLRAISEHAYFWVDDAYLVDDFTVQAAAQQLEAVYYSRVSHLFDGPWAPGMDGDPRFSVLHLAGSGDVYELGYFSDQDEYPRALFRESNEQEIVYLNMGQLELGSDLYYGTLVHELQHLFQWNLDKNEATWFNEGLSQLAELYAGLNTAVADPYLEQPDIPLDDWSYDDATIDAHYGASYLFLVYIWEQLGDEALYELVRHPANGLAAVYAVLKGHAPERDLESFTADWAVANALDDPAAGSRFGYTHLDLDPPALQTRARQLPFTEQREIEQFAVHYVDLDRQGPVRLTFAGDTTARLIASPPTSGEQMWYALPSNDSNAQLTTAVDLTSLNHATLTFNAWYDLELDYDFAYVSVSTDAGQSWQLLYPKDGRDGDYGPAISGKSWEIAGNTNGWVHEQITLDQFAGQNIWVRFQVLTDFETIGRGFALDDIAIPEAGFFDDAEGGSGQWDAQGFVRTGWLLPQQWAVRLLLKGPTPQVVTVPLNALNQAQQSIDLGQDGGLLVVMPLTPFVDETAQYWLNISN
jgi:hypothetical protein